MAFSQKDINRVKRGVRWALLLFGGVSLIVLVLTVDPKATFQSLRQASPWRLLVPLALWASWLAVDGARTQLVALTLGYRLPWRTAVDMIAAGQFLALVTPFQVSGLPYQLYIFQRDAGMPPGPGTALIVLRGFLIYAFVFGAAPLAIKAFGVGSGGFLKAVLVYFSVVASLFFLVFLLSLLKPQVFEKFGKFGRAVGQQALLTRKALWDFFRARRPLPLLGALGLSVVSILLYWSTVPAALWALGLGFDPLKAFLMQALLQGALLYSPSPGAAGVAEGAGAAVFSAVCPRELLGVFIVLWRTFTVYLTALVGGVLFFRRFARGV